MGFREEAMQSCMESTALMNNIKAAMSSLIHEIRMKLKIEGTGCGSGLVMCLPPTS